MKHLIIIFLALIILSCGKDSISYPKSYTFSHLQEFPEGLFLIGNPTNPITLPLNTGTYGANRLALKAQSAEIMQQIFDLQEIELLTENTVRIHIKLDDEELDTIVTYTVEDEEIVIQALEDTDLIYYDKEEDQFVVCGFTTFALPGPNVQNPGQHYYAAFIEDCLEGGGLNEHLDYALTQNSYMPLDTIAIFLTKFIYK